MHPIKRTGVHFPPDHAISQASWGHYRNNVCTDGPRTGLHSVPCRSAPEKNYRDRPLVLEFRLCCQASPVTCVTTTIGTNADILNVLVRTG